MYSAVLCVFVILHIFANFPLWTVHLYAATFKQHLHMKYMFLR